MSTDPIDLEDFLDRRQSRGPRAAPGKIDYNYQNWHNLMNYFLWLQNNDERFSDVCIPNHHIRYRGWKYLAAIVLMYDDQKYRISKRFRTPVDGLCVVVDNSNSKQGTILRSLAAANAPANAPAGGPARGPDPPSARFVIMSLMIFRRWGDRAGHQNVLIVDKDRKTVERFEPHGRYTFFNDIEQTDRLTGEQISEWVNRSIGKIVKQYFPKGFVFKEPTSYMRFRKGVQLKGDLFDGMCITWCTIYIHLRIRNPNKSPSSVYRYLYEKTAEELQDLCGRYARRVEFVLKKNKIQYENAF